MEDIDSLPVRERLRQLVGTLIPGLPPLQVLRSRLQVHIGPALTVIDLAGVEVARYVARRVVRLHLADAAYRHDDVRITRFYMLVERVEVGDFLEQLRFRVRTRRAEAGRGDLEVK